jgi:SAM-dependent methyltransferase
MNRVDRNTRSRITRICIPITVAALLAVAWRPQDGAGSGASDAARWDKVFGSKEPHYRTEPNDFLGRMITRLEKEQWLAPKGKKAIDLAMGDGRNALLLAERGFAVTGIDISTVALAKARDAAKAKGLELDAREADLATFDYGVEQWDLLSIIYFNPALDLASKLKAAVKPGGMIVIEGQGSEHQGGGPPPRTRFAPNALLRAFADWRILHYEDGRFESDWNPGPPTHVVRLMARKPEATR